MARVASVCAATLLAAFQAAAGRQSASPVTPPAPVVATPAVARDQPSAARPTSMEQVRHFAARRLVEANPGRTYVEPAPDVLLAIPVLEIELNADGSVKRIEVLRHPRQAKDTTRLAIDAVRRAGPFGDISRVPKPWRFTETFLFNDDRKFKPRTLE
jgi:hypothetical protein